MQQCLYSIETCADLRIIFRTILRIILRTLLFITAKKASPECLIRREAFLSFWSNLSVLFTN